MRSGTGGPWITSEGLEIRVTTAGVIRQATNPRAVWEVVRKRSRSFRPCRSAVASPAPIRVTTPLAARTMSDMVWLGVSHQSTTGSTGPQMYQPSHRRTRTRRIRVFKWLSMDLDLITNIRPKQWSGRTPNIAQPNILGFVLRQRVGVCICVAVCAPSRGSQVASRSVGPRLLRYPRNRLFRNLEFGIAARWRIHRGSGF